MPLQPEGRKSDRKPRDAAEHSGDRNQHPGRQVEIDLAERGRVGADSEKSGVAERDQAGVPAEQIPRQAEDRPDRHQRQHELVVGIADGQRDRRIEHREDDHRQNRARHPHGQVLSTTRPKNPCGRKKMIRRNTTKIAAFCNWVGSTRVDICCTRPIVMPPQNAPMMLPMPPSTTPAYMTMTYSTPTKG